MLLTRVGNKQVGPNEGFELTPQEYLSLCDDPGWRVFGEDRLLKCYLEQEPVDLTGPRVTDAVSGEKWLSLVHPGTPQVMARSRNTFTWPHAVGRLGINPIYKAKRTSEGTWRLQFNFPSDHYAFENIQMTSFCPQSVIITNETYCNLGANVRSPEVEHLIKQMGSSVCLIAICMHEEPASKTIGKRFDGYITRRAASTTDGRDNRKNMKL